MSKKIKCFILACAVSITSLASLAINTSASTFLPYNDVEGVQCVNINKLADLMDGNISNANHPVFGDGYNITIGDKLITVYEDAPYIFIDGRITTLKNEVVSDNGLEFNFPVMEKSPTDGSDFLIPIFVIEEKLGIKGTEQGIVIEEAKEDVEDFEDDKEDENPINPSEPDDDKEEETPPPVEDDREEETPTPTPEEDKEETPTPEEDKEETPTPEEDKEETPTPAPEEDKEEATPPPVEDNKEEEIPTPAPEEEEPQPTGMSFTEFSSKLPSMGFDNLGSYWENKIRMGNTYVDSSGASFTLYSNSPTFESTLKNCFNMLLPTQGNRLYTIISTPFENQTLQMDGRRVELRVFPEGITIDIYNN